MSEYQIIRFRWREGVATFSISGNLKNLSMVVPCPEPEIHIAAGITPYVSVGMMLAEGEEYAKRLLKSVNNEAADDLVQRLLWEYPSHNFVIDYDEAEDLGLPVERLEIAEEKSLIRVILGLHSDDISYSGFVEAQQQAVARRRQGRPQPRRRPRKVPTTAAAQPDVPITKRTGTTG